MKLVSHESDVKIRNVRNHVRNDVGLLNESVSLHTMNDVTGRIHVKTFARDDGAVARNVVPGTIVTC